MTREEKKIYMKEYRRVNKERIKELEREYYYNNPDVIKRRSNKAYTKHKDSIKKRSNEYYHKNKEIILKKQSEYAKKVYQDRKERYLENSRRHRKNNPGYAANKCAERRSIKLQATPQWLTEFDKEYIKNIYTQASTLSKLEGKKYHVDHIIPLKGKTVCGLHVPWNLQILEASENIKKSNKVPE